MMVSFTHIVIVCMAILGSSIVARGDRPAHQNKGHHHYRPGYPGTKYNDITKFGAVGDGKTDDSKAFLSAWNSACQNPCSYAKLTVPVGKTFLVSAVDFKGPCKSTYITFEILGSIVAPQRSQWTTKNADEWISFHNVDGLTVEGNGQGLINGRGDSWWKMGRTSSRPTALRFSHCNNLQVRGLKHMNSPMNHVSITNCSGADFSYLHMTAPERSPNTDGIDISHSSHINIHDSVMATGDDCIAINGGTSNVQIANISCGPGHGISIGSLGKNGRRDEVEAIHISNCTFNGTENGVRIKTWQGGSGFARNITFTGVTFIEADNPVIIDQYYCPHMKCTNKTSAVQISDVRFSGLHGTSVCKNATINLSCSKTIPCTRIMLEDINITSDEGNLISAQCTNAHGQAHDCVKPTVNCLAS